MYFLKEYFVPLLVTVAFHLLVAIVVLANWSVSAPKSVVKRPNFIQAKLVTLESQNKQKIKKVQKKPKVVDLTKKRKAQELKSKTAAQKRKKAQQQKKAEEQKRKRDLKAKEEAKRKADKLREKASELQRQKHLEQQAFEQAMLEEQQSLTEETYAMEAQSYMAAIAQRIEQNWSRPPSARNGMECELKIQLVPTGRVINVDVIKGSGNAQFDRSAEQAVKKVELFPEIKQMKPEVFERYYRELTLVFKPQDLRQ